MRGSSYGLLAGLALSAAASMQIASAADLSFKAPPAPPAPQRASGYVEAYTGGAWSKDDVGEASGTTLTAFGFPTTEFKYNGGWVLGGAGRANWWAMPNVSVQLDGQAEGTQYKVPDVLLIPGTSNHFSTLAWLVAGHANWRDSERGLVGIFGGLGDAGGNTLTVGSFNSGLRHGLIGAEGQIYWNMFTLYGQAGYDSTLGMGNTSIVSNVHQWFVRGTGRYFFGPNLMVEATGQYANGTLEHSALFGASPDTDFNTLLWRVKGEWRPGMMPFSVFALYEGSRSDFDILPGVGSPFTEKVTDNRVMAGVRVYLGEDTLLGNDRHGATLDIREPLGSPTSPLMLLPLGQATIGAAPVSDIRLKRDIALVGRRGDGLGIYRYRYLWSDTVYIGVMAQEVALIHPDAVVHGLDGYLRVDYSRLGTHLMTLPEWQAQGPTTLSRL
jgi:hypothetical protein